MALTREQMAQRVARELKDGYYVNLGIGIPTLVANYVPEGIDVMLQSENGLLGMGAFPSEAEVDADMILPLTGCGCIRKVLTDLAYLEIEDGAFILRERAPGVSVEEIVAKTAGKLIVPEHVPEMSF